MELLGVIVIGRNEGERLTRCLERVRTLGRPTVYVDSASSDGSPERAETLGATVLRLNTARPLNASRARQEGFDLLMRERPCIFVLFLDGDTELQAGFVEPAIATMHADAVLAAVCGRRREREPTRSIYHRLIDLEWDTPVGTTSACGGDALYRATAVQDVGGFDPTVLAGEEPELCSRLRSAGWKILRLDAEMTLHDADMTRLSQWWRRGVRSEFGSMDVHHRFGRELFGTQVRRAAMWAWGPIALLLIAVAAAPWWPLVAGFAFVMFGVVAGWRLHRLSAQLRGRGFGGRESLHGAALLHVDAVAQAIGQLDWRLRGPSSAGIRQTPRGRKLSSAGVSSAWQLDLARYPSRPFLKEQSVWAIWVYRFGRRVDAMPAGVGRRLRLLYWLLHRVVETATGISLPKAAEIGPGLRIWHFGNIFVHADAIIGSGCTLRQGVTIGSRTDDGPVPIIGDDVDIGAYAQILGGVRIGDGARIGAMSVVLDDVPAGATAVGVPARIVRRAHVEAPLPAAPHVAAELAEVAA